MLQGGLLRLNCLDCSSSLVH